MFGKVQYNLLSFRFRVYNIVSISALNPDMYYQERKSHKESKRLPRFPCIEVINISKPLKLLNTSLICFVFFCFVFFACYEKPNFMHITLLLKRVEPIRDDLLFPN